MLLLSFAESPSYIGIHRVGDSGGNETIASAGEDVELECVVGGANPPAKIRWFARGKEVLSGHTQSDVREGGDANGQEGDKRTFLSVSRLTLPVSKGDNGAEVRCEAEHPTLERPILAITSLNIHCK